MNVDNDTVATQARLSFGVLNLLIKREVQCGPFLVTPRKNIEEIRTRLERLGAKSEITAIGTYPLALPLAHDPWAELWEPAAVMERLLSFFSRCHVQIVSPTIEMETPDGWKPYRRHYYAVEYGRARSTYLNTGELESSLARCYPKLLDREYAESSGPRLALAFYDQIFADDVTELQYLKTYLAFEVLYSRNVRTTEVLSDDAFTELRGRFEALLMLEVEEGRLGGAERAAIGNKLIELNRLSAVSQIRGFLSLVFEGYAHQEVMSREIRAFTQIRNDIVHSGEMTATTQKLLTNVHRGTGERVGDDYVRDLHREFSRLKSLLDRVVRAMFEEQSTRMETSWRYWRLAV